MEEKEGEGEARPGVRKKKGAPRSFYSSRSVYGGRSPPAPLVARSPVFGGESASSADSAPVARVRPLRSIVVETPPIMGAGSLFFLSPARFPGFLHRRRLARRASRPYCGSARRASCLSFGKSDVCSKQLLTNLEDEIFLKGGSVVTPQNFDLVY